jgi:hypothetical protein
VPERRSLRRRPDQQLPVHEHGLVHAPSVQPLRVRLPRGPQPSADRRLGPPEAGGDGAVPGAAGLVDQGVAIASVLSARRTISSVGSRIWVAEQSWQRAPSSPGSARPVRTVTPRPRSAETNQSLP